MSPSRLLSEFSSLWRRLLSGLPAVVSVAAGGVLGSAVRVAIATWFDEGGTVFPVQTLIVNLTGSLLLGLFLARRERAVSRRYSVQFWAIGVFGSFTTFSTFSVETVQLVTTGHPVTAAGYLIGSLAGGVVTTLAGLRIGALVK